MTVQKKNSILVFDSNIFFTGIDFNIFQERVYTTSKILDEIRVKKYLDKNRNILNKIQSAIENKKLNIRDPKTKFIKVVEEKAKITGDLNILSDADKSLIALTLELSISQDDNVILFTNDYSMENLCSNLNLKFSPLYKRGIQKQIIFEVFCPHCLKIYQAENLFQPCEVCGTKLKRRPRNRLNI
ncbi:MAG: NOB1 family endonuclease [Candidatus Thorarchaeota archaeon]